LLAPLIAALPARTSQMAVRLLPHCSERVLGTGVTAEWRAIFDRFGISLHMPPTGCCGMAGMWGHETVNRAKSDKIFHHSWKAATAPGVDAILATGFSCRCQTRHVTGIELQHPVSLLRQLLQAPATMKG
jgi:Fe-S oxidoreductase